MNIPLNTMVDSQTKMLRAALDASSYQKTVFEQLKKDLQGRNDVVSLMAMELANTEIKQADETIAKAKTELSITEKDMNSLDYEG